jgi:hypothetical protein
MCEVDMVEFFYIKQAKFLFIAVVYLLLNLTVHGQVTNGGVHFNTRNEPGNPLFKNRQWEFVIFPNVTQRAFVTHSAGAIYKLGTTPQISGEIGVQRLTHISDRLTLHIGARFGLVGRNSTFIVPYKEIGYDLPGDYPFTGQWAADRDVTYFSFPAQLEYRYYRADLHYWFIAGGLSLRLAPLNGSVTSNMNVMEINIHGNKSPFINVNGGGGIAFLLNNLDILKIALNANYDPFYVAKGTFFLKTESSLDEGLYKLRGTAIGISVNYTRTKAKRIIKNEF